jgi:hypothetical protein
MASVQGGTLSQAGEGEWASSNRVAIELEGMWLRHFSVDSNGRPAALVVAPLALHNARVADLAPGDSLIEALRANGCSRLFLTDWKSATARRSYALSTAIFVISMSPWTTFDRRSI